MDFWSHRKDSIVSLKSAISWSLFYIFCSLAFAGYLYLDHGKESASLFLTGYSLEKVLAFDNLFVFSMIFAYFKIPEERQHAALYWGIAGAIIFRMIFVAIGVTSLNKIGPIAEVIFALLIIFSVYLIIKGGDDDVDYDNAWYTKAIRKVYPGASIFFIAVCVIEISDIMFSFDSVPAIIAITKDPLLIYSSMIFAILGLRSMYFIISSLSRFFVYMDQAVIFVLLFIAGKLLFGTLGMHVEPNISLVIILGILTCGAGASVIIGEKK
jgi:tellurite resistance protein TerC